MSLRETLRKPGQHEAGRQVGAKETLHVGPTALEESPNPGAQDPLADLPDRPSTSLSGNLRAGPIWGN